MTADDVTLTEAEREALDKAFGTYSELLSTIEHILADRLAVLRESGRRQVKDWFDRAVIEQARAESAERRLAEVDGRLRAMAAKADTHRISARAIQAALSARGEGDQAGAALYAEWAQSAQARRDSTEGSTS